MSLTLPLIAFLSCIAAISSLALIAVGAVWLSRMRRAMIVAQNEAAGQQIRTAQRLSEALAHIQKQQEHYTRQIRTLAEAGLRLKQEVASLHDRLDHGDAESGHGGHTLH